MKEICFHAVTLSFVSILSVIVLIAASASDLRAQESVGAAPAANPPPAAAPANMAAPKTEDIGARLTHARALAATGNFTAAVSDLEIARRDAREDSVRDVARVMLMSVHLKMGNYTRSRELLEEAFAGRAATQGGGPNIYFALVGQMLNGVRSRLERYREFGLSTADTTLPVEAQNDLGHIKLLLERLVEQAKLMREGNVANADSTALLEDAASVRLALARDDSERARWQQELAEARQRLAASNARTTGDATRNATAPAASTPTPGAASLTTKAAVEKAGDVVPANAPANAGAGNNATVAAPPNRPADSPATKSTTTSSAPTTTPSTPPASTPPASKPPASTPTPTRPAPQPDTKSTGDATVAAPVAIGSLHDMATQRVSPTYPTIARTARVSGVVTVHLLVNENGAVESVKSASGPAQLQQAATEAARRWKFRQTLVDGQPVRVTGYINFSFSL